MSISRADAKVVAEELHARYDPVRAVVLIARLITKGVFAGRSDDVVFWALVHAHFRGGALTEWSEKQLAELPEAIFTDCEEFH